MSNPTPITVAHGDGIGPEIMAATLQILQAARARIHIETIEIGESVYLRGHSAGIEPSAWESLRRTKVFLKAPITTPQGGGFKSLNVTVRKTLGLFANVRPCVAYAPFVHTKHPSMDVVVVRENEEDLYAGIEYRQTDEVMECIKLMTRPGSERIIRYAFEYARAFNRKKITCFIKDNIMKMTDGMFHRIFKEVAREYPELKSDSMIVDIGAARLADTPEWFDVLVMPNLYGDILSDVAAQIAGSVGLGASANVGEHMAMFEAIHGSAPTIAGHNIANPSGILQSSIMMLLHIGQPDVAELIHNAWLTTIEDGIHTVDIASESRTKEKVGTKEFADAVVKRLGKRPEVLKAVTYRTGDEQMNMQRVLKLTSYPNAKKNLVGVDVILHWAGGDANKLGAEVSRQGETDDLKLLVITNRGVKVWPQGAPETFCTDHWQCRFTAKREGVQVTHGHIIKLLERLVASGYEFVKVENLCDFDGAPGYSMGQGQ